MPRDLSIKRVFVIGSGPMNTKQMFDEFIDVIKGGKLKCREI